MSPSAPRDPAPPRWLEAIARPALSQVMHRVVRTEPPRPVLGAAIRAFARAWGVDLAEAARPVEDYHSFQDFFTRTLKDGLRPIEADPALVPSPSDGRLSAFGPLAEGRLVQAKGVEYSLDALLGGADDAAPYRHGSYAVVYLAPNDYHRVHCPWRGTLTQWRYLPGALYPVNKVGLRHVPGLFARNERIVGHFDCEFGRAALIMVGATFVGHMRVRFTDLATNTGAPASGRVVAEAPLAFERGEELGVFEMGSTVVLLFDRDDLELAGAPRSHGLGARVRVGAPVLRLRGED